jgi:hypothetical protein
VVLELAVSDELGRRLHHLWRPGTVLLLDRDGATAQPLIAADSSQAASRPGVEDHL